MKNAVVEDVERDEIGMFGGGDEAWVIVESEIMLEPEEGDASLLSP